MLQLKSTAILLLLLAFCACTEKNDNSQTYFPKPPAEQLDSIGTWLWEDTNYLKVTYLPFFETHFNQQIAANNIDSAARLLDIAGNVACNNHEFDTVLIQKHLDFLAKYENQIKPRFRSGLYYNLGYISVNNQEYEKSISYLRKNNFTPKDYYSEFNLSWSYYNLLYSFVMIAQYDSAILYGQKALVLFEKNQEKRGQINTYNNISGTYRYMGNREEAKKYNDKSLEIAKEIRDSVEIFRSLYEEVIGYEEIYSPLLYPSIDTLVNFEKKWHPKDAKFTLAAQSVLAMKYFLDSNYVETEKNTKTPCPFITTCQRGLLQ